MLFFNQDFMGDLPISFIEQVDTLIQQHLRNDEFGVENLQSHLAVSYSNLYRKIKEHTGHTPSVYIRIQRLNYACELLRETPLTITAIAYRCGFNNLPYFSKCFTEYYQQTPSQFRKNCRIS